MSEQLISEVRPAATLPVEIIEEMFALFSHYYRDVNRSIFHQDVCAKDWVLLLKGRQNENVQGFTSLRVFDHQYKQQTMTIVYSGDTIIHQSYWNTKTLAKHWIKTVWDLTQEKTHPLYWLLISSGFRTYRYLPVFFKEFFPCYSQQIPKMTKDLMNDIAWSLFGEQFDPGDGIVRFKQGSTPLKGEFTKLSKARLNDPHIDFFTARNAGHADGDELVCLTEISHDNLTAAGKRITR